MFRWPRSLSALFLVYPLHLIKPWCGAYENIPHKPEIHWQLSRALIWRANLARTLHWRSCMHCIFWETPDFKARRGSGQELVEFSLELIRCPWSWQITNWHAYGSRQCRHEDTVARWGLRFIRPTRSNIALLLFVRPCTGIIIRRTSIVRCYRFPVWVLTNS